MNHNVKYYKVNIFITLGLFIFFFLLILVPFIGALDTKEGFGSYITMSIMICVPILLMCIYYVVRYTYYKKVSLKYIQEVKLEKTYPFFNHMSGFVVAMNINGSMRKIDTKAIYSSSMFTILSLDEFIGEVVEVGYDEKNDVAVIIRKV
ncbi:MAG: hypothetical protein E7183_07565 [Erysipelotrichaceae bacterium]|nr:hypothetical protein [Erysipelotrichaceae bacterium]